MEVEERVAAARHATSAPEAGLERLLAVLERPQAHTYLRDVSFRLDRMSALNDRMQAIESEADRLMLELYRDLYRKERAATELLLRKDLFELLEKAIDRCRDVGNTVYRVRGGLFSAGRPGSTMLLSDT